MSKIIWKEHETKKLHLVAHKPQDPNHIDYIDFLTEEELREVWEWSASNNCGKRVSFDMFSFKNKKQITMFLLRWG